MNYGEKFVQKLTDAINTGAYDSYITKVAEEHSNGVKRYVYKLNKQYHPADNLTITARCYPGEVHISVRHPLLEDYKLSYDTERALLNAVVESCARTKSKKDKLKEQKIIEFLGENE